MARLHKTILGTVDHTPLVRLGRIAPGIEARIYGKLECANPGGSSKDRIGVSMVEAAERAGILRPGGTIVEATAGNTGIGLAQAAAVKGYRCVFVLPDKMSQDKIAMLRAYGADVIVTPTVGSEDPDNYHNVARRLASEIEGAWWPDQFSNPSNPAVHYETTGPEIWEDTEGRIDVFVSGMGTCGTISGAGRYLKEKNPRVLVVGAEPEGSIFSGGEPGDYKVEGIGGDVIHPILDRAVIDEIFKIGDREAFLMARRLAREEGILVGGSAGAALAAALRYAQRLQGPKLVVVLLHDTGRNYLSKLFSDAWLEANGFLDSTERERVVAPKINREPAGHGRDAKPRRYGTLAIHAGQEADPRTGAVNVPVHLTTTFKQDAIGKPRAGYEYARTSNPSRDSLEATLAALEGARYGACFASGLAASAAVLQLLEPGDEILSTLDVYGGTYRLFSQVYARWGIAARFLPTSEAGEILAQAGPRTRMIWIESPTNPLLNVIDIAAIARGKPGGALLVVDNTFATPYFQSPLDLGADLVVHSTTKYLGGHSDVVGGAVLTSREDLFERIRFHQNAAGAVPAPFDCYLVQRGLKTLAVRMERHAQNASRLADVLARHSRVERVLFPWLPGHPHHDLARRQMRGPSGMISLRLAGGRAAAERFCERLEVFTLAESLGGVESLACHPATMTHASLPPAERDRIGIVEGLVRLSVGLEDVEDLIDDVAQALAV